MTMRNRSAWLWTLAGIASAALIAQAGCSTQAAGVTCSPGSTVACSCQGSLSGQATCDSSGHEGACNCTGTGSSSGSGSSGGSSSGSSSGGSSGSSSGGEAGAPVEGGAEIDGAVEDGATGG
jgi:hypothetical protein